MLCCCLCHSVAGTPRDLLCDVFRTQILPPPNGNQSSMRLLQSFQVTAASAKWQKATECKQFDAILENCYILKSWKAWWKCEKVRVLDFFAQTPPCWEFLLIFSLQNLPNIFFVTFDKILCCFSFTITLWANRQDLRGLWSTGHLRHWKKSLPDTRQLQPCWCLTSESCRAKIYIFSYFWYWNEKEIDYGFDNDAYDIYIMMKCLSVCHEKWSPITTLYNYRLVMMVPDWFFMVPCRLL